MTSQQFQKESLLKLVLSALEQDDTLRQKYQVGEKFRFIRDRLKDLYARLEAVVSAFKDHMQQETYTLTADEVLVYIYLYNAQGIVLQSWLKMLNPAVFYEYSVNRPIYQSKADIDALIRSKSNKTQHGYITMAIKKDAIMPGSEGLKDGLGHLLIKVKEGSFTEKNLISFTHNNQDYILTEDGQFETKR